jgi:hypothetical protein
MATGIVNGCACRDADATLRLGDLHQSRSRISFRRVILHGTDRGAAERDVAAVGGSCDFYTSICYCYKSQSYAATRLQMLDGEWAPQPNDARVHGVVSLPLP